MRNGRTGCDDSGLNHENCTKLQQNRKRGDNKENEWRQTGE